MFLLKLLLNKLIILNMLNIVTIKAIINENSITKGNYKTLQTGTFYLNSERPLWILQDQKNDKSVIKTKALKGKVKYDHTKPLYYRNRQQSTANTNNPQQYKRNFQAKRLAFISNYQGLQLPRNYIPLRKSSNSHLFTSSRSYQNSKFLHNMPVFDAVPGDETYTESRPIFVYTGHKGRMLLNTMLSKHKYPMQEPVPGQILYPPQTLMFKPQPLVENLQQQLNVTMIPFYAYEAINPRQHKQIKTTTSSSPYASISSSFKSPKKYKKAKQYTAYYSPQEVLSQPVTDNSQYHYHLEYTTNSPLTLEKPYNNHRFTSTPPTFTTPLPHKKFQVSYNDGEDKFQITYEDDTPHLERPINVQTTQFTTTTTQAPLPYESYTIDNNYYAFPLYTMSKLMEKEDNRQRQQETRRDDAEATVERQRIEKYIDTAIKKENDSLLNTSNEEDTWFILNSRYKGPLKTNNNNLHSSKYIQSSPVKVQDDLKLLKTETLATAKTTNPTLQPQQRSKYGENINFIL